MHRIEFRLKLSTCTQPFTKAAIHIMDPRESKFILWVSSITREFDCIKVSGQQKAVDNPSPQGTENAVLKRMISHRSNPERRELEGQGEKDFRIRSTKSVGVFKLVLSNNLNIRRIRNSSMGVPRTQPLFPPGSNFVFDCQVKN